MLSDFANIATIIEAIFIIVSVWFIWRQLRESTQLARAANAQSLVEISSSLNLQLIQDPEMASLWVRGARELETMDEVRIFRYQSLLVWWLILHENIYYQHRKRLLDNDVYAAWNADLRKFVKEQNLAGQWQGMKQSYQNEFAAHVQRLIDEIPPVAEITPK